MATVTRSLSTMNPEPSIRTCKDNNFIKQTTTKPYHMSWAMLSLISYFTAHDLCEQGWTSSKCPFGWSSFWPYRTDGVTLKFILLDEVYGKNGKERKNNMVRFRPPCNYIPYLNDWGPSEFLYREPVAQRARLSVSAYRHNPSHLGSV